MSSSGMLRRVALVRTDISEELSASIIRVVRIGELGTLAVTSNRRTLRRNTKCVWRFERRPEHEADNLTALPHRPPRPATGTGVLFTLCTWHFVCGKCKGLCLEKVGDSRQYQRSLQNSSMQTGKWDEDLPLFQPEI
jgi:hypothetical protein